MRYKPREQFFLGLRCNKERTETIICKHKNKYYKTGYLKLKYLKDADRVAAKFDRESFLAALKLQTRIVATMCWRYYSSTRTKSILIWIQWMVSYWVDRSAKDAISQTASVHSPGKKRNMKLHLYLTKMDTGIRKFRHGR